MRLTPLHRDAENVGSGVTGAWPETKRAGVKVRSHMQAEYDIRLRAFERAFLEHLACAACFALRQAFLCRLEDELHSSGQFGLVLGKYLSRGHEYRDVGVVAARMHHALVSAGMGKPCLFLDGQCIQVGAQSEPTRPVTAPQAPDDTGATKAAGDLESE